MSAREPLSQGRAWVGEDLFPDLHQHQSRALADLRFAVRAAGSCPSGLVAVAVPVRARTARNPRRIERTLASWRLQPHGRFQVSAQFLVSRLAGRPLILILDEPHKAARLACLKLSLADRCRARPIAAVCYHRDRPPPLVGIRSAPCPEYLAAGLPLAPSDLFQGRTMPQGLDLYPS